MRATWKTGLVVVVWVVVGSVASPGFCGTLCGAVQNAQGQPINGAQLTVKDPSGLFLGQGTTGSDGGYTIDGILPGTIYLFLDTTSIPPYKPGSGVLDFTEPSNRVNWKVSDAVQASAAFNGTCTVVGAGEYWPEVGLALILAGTGGLVYWAVSGGSSSGPISPQE